MWWLFYKHRVFCYVNISSIFIYVNNVGFLQSTYLYCHAKPNRQYLLTLQVSSSVEHYMVMVISHILSVVISYVPANMKCWTNAGFMLVHFTDCGSVFIQHFFNVFCQLNCACIQCMCLYIAFGIERLRLSLNQVANAPFQFQWTAMNIVKLHFVKLTNTVLTVRGRKYISVYIMAFVVFLYKQW